MDGTNLRVCLNGLLFNVWAFQFWVTLNDTSSVLDGVGFD